ncbi:MAG: hypothetical protein LBU04_01900 [Christensenellaceae bacterium]|jgi:16S rRNA (cytosine967-C5)-methyltransferase|nr:hypothetical protein [Christensenellaceae bacterium]
MSNWRTSYDSIARIIRDGAYANLELNKLDEKDEKFVKQVVYGTLENYFEIESIIDSICQKSPQPAVRILLLQAIYALRYMNIPDYAVVNEHVNLVEEIGKEPLKGFVNAVLKRVCSGDYLFPAEDDPRYSEIKYKLPLWLIEEIKKEYPDNYDDILYVEGRREKHVRLSPKTRSGAFEERVKSFTKTDTGYYVAHSPYIDQMFEKGKLTYQSYTSTLAVTCAGDVNGKSVLDLCAAPGGKSVFFAERGAIVTSCDIYPHRIDLIKKYADRMGVELKIMQNDATTIKTDWVREFDVVLVDAPCSGIGVISKRRDIIFKRSQKDIKVLAEIQARILDVSATYVKRNGLLIYSTCTILSAENSSVINGFIKAHPAFRLEFEKQFLPSNDGTDGFYIAKLIRRA